MFENSKFERGSIGRWKVGALFVALALVSSASISAAQSTIEACQDRDGKITIIDPRGDHGPSGCVGRQVLLTWSVAGPQGPTGPTGQQGQAGSEGPSGALGPVGSTGVAGPTGPTGPRGLTGASGPTGASGSSQQMLFGGTQANPMDVTNSTYMGPGNGSLVTAIQTTGTETIGVPMPALGILSNLQVSVLLGPTSVADSWTFNVCDNEDCSANMQCSISGSGGGPAPATCSDTIDFTILNLGDRLTIQAVPNNGSASMPPTPASFSLTYAPQT
jgi:Collagen triple helix repeat (20 copies)